MSDLNPYQAPESELPEPQVDTTGEPVLASRWIRLGAAIIDSLISSAIVFPFMYLTGYWSKAMAGTVSLGDTAILSIAGFVIYLLLHARFLAKNGQTIGKKLLKIKIVGYETNAILPLGTILGKRLAPIWLATLIPYAGNAINLMNPLLIFRKDRRCLHDLIAGTKVIVE